MEHLSLSEIAALKKEIFSSLHCALPGTVESFDPSTQTASVRPALRKGSFLLPALHDIPVFFPGSRISGITWPVSAGDECLLVFADCDLDRWFESGEENEADSGRQHDLSDAFAFVGFRSRVNSLADVPEAPSFFGIRPADVNHDHDDRYYTEAETDSKLSGKAAADHDHDGRYYTEAEVDSKLSGKAAADHDHDSRYYTETEVDARLEDLAMIACGTCATAGGTAEKEVVIDNPNWQLKAGCVIGVRFANTNTFSATSSRPVSLNVNHTGAIPVYWNNTAGPTGTNTTAFGYASRVIYYMYDGTYWVWMGASVELNDNTVPSAYCSTAAATAAKTASCSGYALLSKSYIQVIVTQANTAASALTLNIAGKGAKPVYINGSASGTTNYTLPAGSYLVYCDGTNYQFRTDGQIPGPARSVALGGTGQTGTGATATVADIATAAADCEITTAQYAYWGKVAMVRLVVKKTAAVSSDTTTLCTLVSGKRPKYTAMGQWLWNNGAAVNASGTVQVNGAISAGASLTILATYILA